MIDLKLGDPPLPQRLLNIIGEYGMARTDGLSETEILHRWDALIADIQDYARSAANAEPAQLGGLTDAQIIATFETEMKRDPEAYTRHGECVNQITSKEIVRAVRVILAQAAPVQRALSRLEIAATAVKHFGNPMPPEAYRFADDIIAAISAPVQQAGHVPDCDLNAENAKLRADLAAVAVRLHSLCASIEHALCPSSGFAAPQPGEKNV